MTRGCFALLLLPLAAACTQDRQRFMAAIRDGDQAQLEALLQRDPSFVHLYYAQNTGKYAGMHTRPLLEAADHDRVGIVKILLDYGADPNQYSRSRVTALHVAAKHGYGDIVELLITRGADVNRIDSWGRTPLYDALGAAQTALLAHGAVIGIPDQDGNTPLHEAALTDGLREAVVLCAHGANPEARNLKGQIPGDLPDTRAPELRA
ncbi:MAG TPA: ankyrin repeat domain-containing protein, partial [Vicinamibacterales bacterium]|nr:ankyrin repeat domain-containing protein [Vicinamibacterales bacterium]